MSRRGVAWLMAAVVLAWAGCGGAPPAATARPERAAAQENELPVLVVQTQGATIVDEPKIEARLTVNRAPQSPADFCRDLQPVGEPRTIGIELRGRTSQFFYKKPQLGFSFRDHDRHAEPFMGLPPSKKWVLHGPYADKSLMRNALAYRMASSMKQPAPQTRFVELCLETAVGKREYLGVYLLTEHVRLENHLRPLGSSPVRREFLVKVDSFDPGEEPWVTRYGTTLVHVDGKQKKAHEAIARFEEVLTQDALEDERFYSQLQDLVDLESFADYFLLSELSRNVDAYDKSVYLHRVKGGRLTMGPVWDFNLAFGNASYRDGWRIDGWVVRSYAVHEIPFWWDRLLESERFRRLVQTRWQTLRQTVLRPNEVNDQVDAWSRELERARQRNFARWPVLGGYVWPNPHPIATGDLDEVEQLKTWIRHRCEWLDEQMSKLDLHFEPKGL